MLLRWEKSLYPVSCIHFTYHPLIPRLDRMFPEFKPNSEFINQHLNAALSLDAKLSSHPIEVPCPDAEAIGQVSIDVICGSIN